VCAKVTVIQHLLKVGWSHIVEFLHLSTTMKKFSNVCVCVGREGRGGGGGFL